MDARILISPHWDIEFHVHTNAYNLIVGAMLFINSIKPAPKDQVVGSSKILGMHFQRTTIDLDEEMEEGENIDGTNTQLETSK
jgi:hypothetical protein